MKNNNNSIILQLSYQEYNNLVNSIEMLRDVLKATLDEDMQRHANEVLKVVDREYVRGLMLARKENAMVN